MKRWIVLCMAVVVQGGCDHPRRLTQETPECMDYRAMMTAPMPPDAMRRLQARCVESRRPE